MHPAGRAAVGTRRRAKRASLRRRNEPQAELLSINRAPGQVSRAPGKKGRRNGATISGGRSSASWIGASARNRPRIRGSLAPQLRAAAYFPEFEAKWVKCTGELAPGERDLERRQDAREEPLLSTPCRRSIRKLSRSLGLLADGARRFARGWYLEDGRAFLLLESVGFCHWCSEYLCIFMFTALLFWFFCFIELFVFFLYQNILKSKILS